MISGGVASSCLRYDGEAMVCPCSGRHEGRPSDSPDSRKHLEASSPSDCGRLDRTRNAALKFTMQFEPMTIEHLGLRLYNSLPPVITELVSNAYDADSKSVEISLPTGEINATSEVIVRDYGHGMNETAIQSEYLPIGRNRRGDDSTLAMSKSGKRQVTGRKGLGKLSCFGIAEEMEVRSVVGGKAITLRLNYAKMKSWPAGTPYEPEIVSERTGTTKDKDGVEIRMRNLRRKYKISDDSIRQGLAKRLDFIGPKFVVKVNGSGIKPGDRVSRNQCEDGWSWDLTELPHGDVVGEGLKVSGWIGFLDEASSTGRGVDIFAHGKAAELGSFFNFPSTHAQFPRSYLVGHINADFLDESGGDLIGTARNEVLWELPAAHDLQVWGEKTLQWAFQQWLELRKKKKKARILKIGKFDEWLKTRDERERKAAQRMVNFLVDDDRIDADTAEPLLEIVKVSIESAAFADLLQDLEEHSASVGTLLGLFSEWRIIEAREHLRLADGRRAVIEQLDEFIRTGALEVQEMQPLLRDNLWLLDPGWIEVQVEQHYTKLLEKHAKEPKSTPEQDRRVDILGVSEGHELTIVEIKKPQKTLSRSDLNQIESYVDWARTELVGNDDRSFKYVRGLLIVGSLGKSAELQQKRARMEGSDIRVLTFADLSRRSNEFYKLIEKRLQSVAPEYSRARRQAGKKKK